MRLLSQICLSLTLLSPVLSLPSNLIVKESVAKPEGWFETSSTLSQSKLLDFKIGLKQPRLFTLQSKLDQFYDPETVQTSTERFSAEEIASHLEPEQADVEKVSKWLQENGVEFNQEALDKLGGWIKVKVDVQKAEKMFDAKFSEFQNEMDGKKLIRTLKYSLPKDLSK